MEKKENRRKSDTIDKEIIRNHKDIVESFLRAMIKAYGEVDDNDRYSYYTARLHKAVKDDTEI